MSIKEFIEQGFTIMIRLADGEYKEVHISQNTEGHLTYITLKLEPELWDNESKNGVVIHDIVDKNGWHFAGFYEDVDTDAEVLENRILAYIESLDPVEIEKWKDAMWKESYEE